ncbi:MAG TPA: Ldh family oxidoreductase, partial [Pseudonocardia sp.]|nr:Ldh family oxidoreductase [Pseudonocardia sp.]
DVRSAANGTGAIRAFAEHKGSGLALMCELLAGALTGGGTAGPADGRAGISNGMLSVYLSPDGFGTRAEFERIGREHLDWVLAARPVDPALPVLAPGDPEARMRAARTAGGVPLPVAAWDGIRATAARLGVTVTEGRA